MIEAIIFDMDGVIIDSEPFWRQAEIEIFNKIGVKMTEEMCLQMKGTKIDEVVRHWHAIYNWKEPSIDIVENEIIEKLISLVNEQGEGMPGLMGLLEYFRSSNIKIGLATSSLYRIMDAVLDKLNIRSYFDVVHSAESEKLGKPAPDVYLGAALKLGVEPKNCIAIEDSHTGLLAAKAAGMYTIAIPEQPEFELEKYNIADMKIKSLKEVIHLDLVNKYKAVS